ncbi:MAG TPA: hypothetical protein PKN33_20985 [Phycisphaerae bacterium]|nr:hypothetical protein [Phycisphaerae bacterium]
MPRYRAKGRDPPPPDPTLDTLRPSEQRLIDIVRKIEFGTVPNIPVQDGELLLGDKVKTKRKHRLGNADSSRSKRPIDDRFKLKQQHLDLITTIRRIKDGTVTIGVQDGLPIHVDVEEELSV